MAHRRLRWFALAPILVVASVLAFDKVNPTLINVRGTVIDGMSLAPVPGVQVTVECSTNNLLHGTTLLRRIEDKTPADGTYHVPYRKLWDCDNAYISVEKRGYKRSWDDLPAKELRLFKDADAVRTGLEVELSNSRIEYRTDSTALQRYQNLYIHFLNSRMRAESQLNAEWIAENYCDRLQELHQKLSESDRKIRERGFRGTHDGQVSSYCARPVVEPKDLIPRSGWTEDPEDVKRWGGAA
jgi:hypothetical protein